MRVMVLVKANEDSERGDYSGHAEEFAAMGKYNEELLKAGIMLAGEGLTPSSDGKRVAFASLFGHMMDVGGKAPGSQVSDALSIWEEGIRIPPIKIFRKGELNETALEVILNNSA